MRKKLILIITTIFLLVSCKIVEHDLDEFISRHSTTYPVIEELVNSFVIEENTFMILQEDESKLVFSFDTPSSYEEIDTITYDFFDEIHKEYNTSLAGRLNMEEDGYINYSVAIIESKDFNLDVVNINNYKAFKKDNKDSKYNIKVNSNKVLIEISSK